MAEMKIEDARGKRVTITEAHWKKYPQLAEKFTPVEPVKRAARKPAARKPRKTAKTTRPVADAKTTSVVTNTPTGDEDKE